MRLLRALAALAALAVATAVLVPVPAAAQVPAGTQGAELTLVSNLDETTDLTRDTYYRQSQGDLLLCFGQPFSAGSHPHGYRLSSLELAVGETADNAPLDGIWVYLAPPPDRPQDGRPDARFEVGRINGVYSAGSPVSIDLTDDDVVLASGQSYWVYVCRDDDDARVALTNSDDQTGEAGWQIADTTRRHEGGNWSGPSTVINPAIKTSGVMQFRIKGYEQAAPATNSPGEVTLTDADSDGDPEVGDAITATLADDNTVTAGSVTWQWWRGPKPSGTFTSIAQATSASYTPVAADDGFYLRATALYVDGLAHGQTASATTPRPVDASPDTLVKNTSKPSNNARTGDGIAVAFTTGSNPAGYGLHRIGIGFRSNPRSGAVTIRTYTDRTTPGATVATLAPPDSLASNRVNWFAAPPGTILDADTNYFLVVSSPNLIETTAATSEDAGAAHGWAIADFLLSLSFGNYQTSFSIPRIDIEGFELLGQPGPPTRLSASFSSGGAELSWSPPTATGRRSVTKYQVRHKQSDLADSDYSAWADVDSDSDGNLAEERSVTVSGLTVDAEYAFEVRAVNERGASDGAQVIATYEFSRVMVPTVIAGGDDPVLGTAITATLPDADSNNANQVWQWSRGKLPDGEFTDIPDANNGAGSNTSTYTPNVADVGHYLRVVVGYDDGERTDEAAGSSTDVPVSGQTLVSNLDETTDLTRTTDATSTSDNYGCFANSFTTGSHPVGYRLSSVELIVGGTSNKSLNIDIFTSRSGRPAQDNGSIPNPASRGNVAAVSADVPPEVVARTYSLVDANAVLAPSTTYWLRVCEGESDYSGVASVGVTDTDAQSGDTAWEIGDTMRAYAVASGSFADLATVSGGNASFKTSGSMQFRIRGYRVAAPPGTPGQVLIDDSLKPEVGVALTARLSDVDGPVSQQVWQWSRSATADGEFTDIADADGGAGTVTSAYTLTADDVGHFLRATVTYTDATGADQTASATTAVVVETPRVLVSNAKQTAGTEYTMPRHRFWGAATSFRTGPNPDGYVLESVALGLAVGSSARVSVEIRDDGNNRPGGTRLASLSGSPDNDTSTFDVFTSATGVRLEPNTWYWVAVRRANAEASGSSYAVKAATTNTNSTDTISPGLGFDIGDGRSKVEGSQWHGQSASDHELKFTLRGSVIHPGTFL